VIDAAVERALEAEIAAFVAQPAADPLGGSVIPAGLAAELIARHSLRSVDELALAALPVAGTLARPPISGFRVPAVGVEAGTGDLVLGGNLEFAGSELTTTVHAEGFVSLRARRRGHALATLAVREARPCAHCRQTLSEAAAADDLRIIDTLGNERRLADLYPWPFRPAALGMDGDIPGRVAWPALAVVPRAPGIPADVQEALLDAGRLAHAPYSGAPSAVALRTRSGRLVSAGCVESVSFNPTISALQAALVEVVAAREEPADVVEGWLAAADGAAVDPEAAFRALLHAVAPAAPAHVVRWRANA
jgi:cytidine deaminase